MYRPSGEADPTVIRSQGDVVATSSRLGQSFYLVGGGTVRYSHRGGQRQTLTI